LTSSHNDQRDLIRQALSDENQIWAKRGPGGIAGPGFVVLAKFDQAIGTKAETCLRVVVSSDGRVVTAFPVKRW
jgi:hypothetical protein